MKKTSIWKRAFVVLLCIMACHIGRAQDIFFQEDFSTITNSNTEITDNLNDYTAVPGWTGGKVYTYTGKIKMGSSSGLGWVMTPAIDLSGDDGEFTLSFDATAWNGDSTTLKVYVDETLYLVRGLNNSNDYDNLDHFILNLTGGTATTKIKFEGNQSGKGRFFLDNVVISRTTGETPLMPLATPAINPAAGNYHDSVNVTITSSVEGAEIHYTLDGSDPDSLSTVYATAFTLTESGTVKAIAYKEGYLPSQIATASYVITPSIADTLAYATGFERSEGYTISSQYNNLVENLNGPSDYQWGIVYGTAATSGAISDSASLQMRWYKNNPDNIGTSRTTFDITHATRITFKAKSTNGLNVLVSYSIDGGNSYIDSLFTLSNNVRDYELVVSETAEFDNVRFKFTIALPETAPTSNSNLYIDNVNIYNFPSLISQTVEMPVISPNGGFTFEPTEVSISCETEGATIYYTTDGTTPDENATLYENPFNVSANTTVKAIAYKTGFTASNIATATYTFPIEVANIADFKAATGVSSNTIYKITGDVVFVFQSGANIYVQDTTGGLLIYNNPAIIDGEYNEGDVISGGVCGHCSMYNGLLEMVPDHNLAPSTSNIGLITPTDTDVEAIEAHYSTLESRLVTLHNVTFTEGGTYTTSSTSNLIIEQNGETMQVRNNFKTLDMTIPAGTVADVTGFVLIYSTSNATNYQIAPRNNDDIHFVVEELDTVETPQIEVNKLTNDMYDVNITCETEDATIYYTTDGTTPDENATEYTGNFTTEGGTTIKAIAVKEGMVNSEIAIYANVGINNILAGNVNIYPNPTTGNLSIENGNLSIENVFVYDVYGKLLESISGDVHTINMSGFTAGTYFLRINTKEGMIVKKVVRQ